MNKLELIEEREVEPIYLRERKMSSVANVDINRKPHAVCVPFPYQGHITPMIQLAKLLNFHGFHITFVHSDYNLNRLVKSQGTEAVRGLKDFRFQSIPDGLPPTDGDAHQDLPSLIESVNKHGPTQLKNLLAKLHKDSDKSPENNPAVTCIISDMVMSFVVDIGEELNIPVSSYCIFGACAYVGFSVFHSLVERQLVPLKDASQLTDGYMNTKVNLKIPGMEALSLKDLPSFLRTTDQNDFMFNFAIQAVKRMNYARVAIFNTFDALEHDILDYLSKCGTFKHVISVSPLGLALESIIPKQSPLHSIEGNLWKEEPECILWLNKREKNSVVYVNFGSTVVTTQEQLMEFAWGLANSNYHFLWIIRPDLVEGKNAMLPSEFTERTKGRGMLAGWCPQKEVLNHPAIGGFLTHTGWNSILETISAGVPTICWPFFADHPTYCYYACNDWGFGMELDNNVKSNVVEKLVRELMEGDKGKEMRKNAMKWKRLAKEATGPNGSSTLGLKKLVQLLTQERA